jgi:hypothetical protein
VARKDDIDTDVIDDVVIVVIIVFIIVVVIVVVVVDSDGCYVARGGVSRDVCGEEICEDDVADAVADGDSVFVSFDSR